MFVCGPEWMCASRSQAIVIATEVLQVGFVNSEAV
jgi:lipid-binding SYLF domain-containing protein